MAVSFGAWGTATAATGSATAPAPSYPTGITAGDMLFCFLISKYGTVTTPSGWTLLSNAQFTGGSSAARLTDSGDATFTCFIKEADGTETGTLTLAVASTTGASAAAIIGRASKTAGMNWDSAACGAAYNGAADPISVTADSNPGITSGDLLIFGYGNNGDQFAVVAGSPSVAATGATIGSTANVQTIGSTTGQDVEAYIGTAAVTAGTASAAPVLTCDITGTVTAESPKGGAVILRLREVSTGTTVSPGVGALIATGFAALVAISDNKVVQPGAGAATMTGQVSTIVLSDNKIVQPGAGQANTVGFSPSINIGTNIAVGSGTITATGFSPSVQVSNNISAVAGLGQLSATGFAPSTAVSDNKIVLPGTGVLTATGFAPAIIKGTVVYAGTGQALYSGQVPTIINPVKVFVGTGQVIATGQAPFAGGGTNVQAGRGQEIATGFAPSVFTPNILRANTGDMQAIGFAPVVLLPQVVRPGVGQAVFTGFDPLAFLFQPGLVQPGTGVLIYTGYAPQLSTLTFKRVSRITSSLKAASEINGSFIRKSKIEL
jgi:hypothetical protein